jgi:hypothetical protein
MHLNNSLRSSGPNPEATRNLDPVGKKSMLNRNGSLIVVFVLLATLTATLIVAHGAGGRIEGKVTDPKGSTGGRVSNDHR